ncbi:CDP-alcohol phosphatidyltransferase family protein [Pseudaestuariivita rosea]|uniref:CDP-alcohol phosphatidyltransferase family protein n=1 Tax=Pseudaestuariivita rosea TaxID=2763263 RepID=UPI001ABBE1E0|nr:CDP-alcohol phosphatidyltransferase family protein [Pseudaestuariivita rosea]
MSEDVSRRPIASRQSAWAKKLAVKLADAQISPNQISQASIAFAALAGVAFALSGLASGFGLRAFLLILAMLCCGLRLICNLLDGMVADESGQPEPDGALWNEVPDRVSDTLILVGAGLGAGVPVLGWAAAVFAVMTAYVREFGRAEGFAQDFSGPFAKPHRMIALCVGALVAIFWSNTALLIALLIVALGTLGTAGWRAYKIMTQMQQKRPSRVVKPRKVVDEATGEETEELTEDEEDEALMRRLKKMSKA